MKRPVSENNKAGDSAPPTAASHSMFYPPSKAAVHKHVEHDEMSSDQIAYACEVMTREFKIDPILARSFFYHDSVRVRKNGRKNAAERFRKEYAYGSGKDRKTCIWPGDTLLWQDESSGTIWVGVHGMDSICTVTRSGDLDVTRVRGSLDQWPIDKVFFNFRKSLIVEIEDFADASSKLRQRFPQKIEKPFGVDSNKVLKTIIHILGCLLVLPGENIGNPAVASYYSLNMAPSTEYGAMKAIEFLQEKMNSDTVFTVSETIQTAISAFQHLFQKEVQTDEILVSVMDPKYSVTSKHKDPTVEELNIGQIKEHLDVINKPGPLCHKEKTEYHPEDFSSGSQRHGEWKLQECNLRSCSGGGPETKGSTITSEATD